MAGAVYTDDAKASLADLEADKARAALAERVNASLDRLENDPFDRAVRRRQLQTLGAWAWVIEVEASRDEWWIIWGWWDDAGGDEHLPRVFYIGPAPGG